MKSVPVVSLSPLTLLSACGSNGVSELSIPQLRKAKGATITSCTDLNTRFSFANTTIASADTVAAGTLTLAGNAVPEHCLVKGSMFKRTGSDGGTYAIGFEMRLPKGWSGRYYYRANGGTDGSVSTAVGATGGGPITHGIAARVYGHQRGRGTHRRAGLQLAEGRCRHWCKIPTLARKPLASRPTCLHAAAHATALV